MERISVVIPTYNRGKILERSIRSVLAQTYRELELLIVDDGSDDNTPEIAEGTGDSRVRYIRLPKNGGVSRARNEGAKQAKGPLLAFQDSDDCWRPDKLKRQMEYWQAHPEYSLLCCDYLYHMPDGQALRVPADTIGGKLEGELFPSLLLRNSIGTPTMLLRRESFLESGGFDTELKSLEDWEFVLRFSREHQIGYVSEILVDAYLSAGGVSSNTGAYYESRCRMIAGYKEELLTLGLFDQAVGDLFARAEQGGILDSVSKMLMICLQ